MFGPFESMNDRDKDKARHAARAALEAMREPTPAMIRSAIHATDAELTDQQRDIGAEAIAGLPPLAPHRQRQGLIAATEIARDWQAMIAAALNEE